MCITGNDGAVHLRQWLTCRSSQIASLAWSVVDADALTNDTLPRYCKNASTIVKYSPRCPMQTFTLKLTTMPAIVAWSWARFPLALDAQKSANLGWKLTCPAAHHYASGMDSFSQTTRQQSGLHNSESPLVPAIHRALYEQSFFWQTGSNYLFVVQGPAFSRFWKPAGYIWDSKGLFLLVSLQRSEGINFNFPLTYAHFIWSVVLWLRNIIFHTASGTNDRHICWVETIFATGRAPVRNLSLFKDRDMRGSSVFLTTRAHEWDRPVDSIKHIVQPEEITLSWVITFSRVLRLHI